MTGTNDQHRNLDTLAETNFRTMQSDSSSGKVDLSSDATTSRQANEAWVKGLENLESMFTDENDFRDENKDDKSKDVNSPAFPSASDVVRGCLSPSNLFNDCTNRSADNSNDKPSDRSVKLERSEKPEDDKLTPEKSSGKQDDKPVESKESSGDRSPFRSDEPEDADDESEEMETNEKSSESDEDEEMAGPSQAKDEEVNDREALSTEEEDEQDEEENSEEDEEEDEEKKKKSKKRKAFNERKNIKRLIKEEDLDESILNARKQEEERINRILEHLKSEQGQQLAVRAEARVDRPQTVDIVLSSDEDDVQVIELSEEEKSDEDIIKVYEKIPDELDSANSGLHTDDSLNRLNKDGRCLVNVGHPSDEPDVYLDDYLSKKVKPHQIGGIRFMYDCVIESIAKVKTCEGIGGCILAHSMGKWTV